MLRPRDSLKAIFILVSIIAALTYAAVASAGLGDSEEFIEADRASLAGALRAPKTLNQCTIHEFVTPNGLSVKEYVLDGVVARVSWAGPRHPDLSSLLGSYFQEYSAELSGNRKLHGQMIFHRVSGAHIVVEKSGHMRAVRGTAYIPALLPPGGSCGE